MPSTTLHRARLARRCGSYPCDGTIEPGTLYVRHVAFPGDEGHEEGVRPWVIEQCYACANGQLDWIRDHYRVPAAVGAYVTVNRPPAPVRGRIITGVGDRLMVLVDGKRKPSLYHPTEFLTYPSGVAARPVVSTRTPRTVTVELAGVL